MTDIGKVCGLIGLCGSLYDGVFLTREFGCIGMGRRYQTPASFFFDYEPFMIDIIEAENPSCKETTKYWPEFHNINDLDDHVVRFYQAVKTKEKNIIGFKGGIGERQVLEYSNIPYVNIEEIGCPSYEELSCERFDRFACPFHRDDESPCPKAEVAAFKYWLSKNCRV